MPKFIDIAGQRFGALVVVARAGTGTPTRWLVRCDCGREVIRKGTAIRSQADTAWCGVGFNHLSLKREAVSDGTCIAIGLTRGATTTIDAVDEDLARRNWLVLEATDGRRYAGRRQTGKLILLHRVIAERSGLVIDDLDVDHRDGDGLNNRRENLRPATTAQNQHNSRRHRDNTSGVKGVSWNEMNQNWEARIQVNKQRTFLGTFATKEEAAVAYAEAAETHHRDFARPDRAP